MILSRSRTVPLSLAAAAGALFLPLAAHADAPVAPSAAPPSPTPSAPYAVQPAPVWAPAPPAWQPGEAVPPGYKVIEERRRWLFLTGIIPFASVWGFSAILGGFAAAVGTNKTAAGLFIIPVAGPFIDLATQKMQAADRVFCVVDGSLQILSAAALVASFAWPKKKLVPALADFHAAPVVTRDMAGLAFGGAF